MGIGPKLYQRAARGMLGTIIGEKYLLDRSIGTGGMGEVYEARHVVTGRAVAVKLLYQQPPRNEAAASDRFRHEAHAAGTLDAEHIVQVFDAGLDRDTCRRYLVMELLHGESLHTLIKRIGPLSPELAFCIVGQAALGLAKAHAAGIIHRDVKPANIFLTLQSDEVVVKVLDFGIAKVKDLDDAEAEQAAMAGNGEAIVGSPHYMSPEQAQGLPTLDHRSDLFSLGAVLYRLLSGQTPHPSADTLVRLMYAICTEPARPLTEVAPWIPADMVDFVEQAMAIDPSSRFQSAGEMAHAIASIVGDLRIAPADIAPLSAEERGARGPSSMRRFSAHESQPEGRVWDQTLQGSASQGGARLVSSRGARSDKGSLGTAILGAMAMALVLVAIVGLWRSRTGAPPRAVSAAMAAQVAPAPQTPAEATPPVETRAVWVHVHPADDVFVDGHRVTISPSGYVEVEGSLGSRHELWVSAAGRMKSTQVVITPEGAFPDAVAFTNAPQGGRELPVARPHRRAKHEAADAGRASASAEPSATVRAPRPAAPPTELPEDPFGAIKLPMEKKSFDD